LRYGPSAQKVSAGKFNDELSPNLAIKVLEGITPDHSFSTTYFAVVTPVLPENPATSLNIYGLATGASVKHTLKK
jgi:phage tail sheath gpL-like